MAIRVVREMGLMLQRMVLRVSVLVIARGVGMADPQPSLLIRPTSDFDTTVQYAIQVRKTRVRLITPTHILALAKIQLTEITNLAVPEEA